MKEHYLFVKHHLGQIRKGGLKILFRKATTLICYHRVIHKLVLLIPLLPLVILLRLLRPIILIRFGLLDSRRLGHYAANVELYLCERDAGFYPKNSFDIFFNNDPSFVCNKQLEIMWRRCNLLKFYEIGRYINFTSKFLPGSKAHIVLMPSDRDIRGLYERIPVHLSFTPDEEKMGSEALQRMGIPDGAKFICFHARDSAYLNATYPTSNWSYQDFRDSDIKNFIPAMEELTRRGYYAIRMGAVVKEALKTDNPSIIDYATNFRTEFLDIYLGAKCSFYFGDCCGVNAPSFIFRRPIASTNFAQIEYIITWGSQNVSIIKKFWLRNEKRFMTLREILESGVGRFHEGTHFARMGIDLIENTPDEILALAVEMDERLLGTYKPTAEDEELQRLFWSFFKPSDLNLIFRARIGADFLRKNKFLLQ
jgi:putative glycosyltransferase (TIGR04372 family)